jgi:hypothetical protein
MPAPLPSRKRPLAYQRCFNFARLLRNVQIGKKSYVLHQRELAGTVLGERILFPRVGSFASSVRHGGAPLPMSASPWKRLDYCVAAKCREGPHALQRTVELFDQFVSTAEPRCRNVNAGRSHCKRESFFAGADGTYVREAQNQTSESEMVAVLSTHIAQWPPPVALGFALICWVQAEAGVCRHGNAAGKRGAHRVHP